MLFWWAPYTSCNRTSKSKVLIRQNHCNKNKSNCGRIFFFFFWIGGIKIALRDKTWLNVPSLITWGVEEGLQPAVYLCNHSLPSWLFPWLYLSCSFPSFEAHCSQACLELGHIHFSILVGVQLGEQILVGFKPIFGALTVREKQLPYDLIHAWTKVEISFPIEPQTHPHSHLAMELCGNTHTTRFLTRLFLSSATLPCCLKAISAEQLAEGVVESFSNDGTVWNYVYSRDAVCGWGRLRH